jgi:hypothetical protein
MLAEHQFITTLPGEQVMEIAGAFLRDLGFQMETVSANQIVAVRGKKRNRSRVVSELPQTFTLTFDRGKVVAALSITPRCDRPKDLYKPWLLEFLHTVEMLFAENSDSGNLAMQFRANESRIPKIWFLSEKIGLVFLIFVLAMILTIVLSLVFE